MSQIENRKAAFHPIPQGGNYRPHYRKRDADAYIAQLIGALSDVQDAIANLNGIEIPYDRSQRLSRCYNANAALLTLHAARITGVVLAAAPENEPHDAPISQRRETDEH